MQCEFLPVWSSELEKSGTSTGNQSHLNEPQDRLDTFLVTLWEMDSRFDHAGAIAETHPAAAAFSFASDSPSLQRHRIIVLQKDALVSAVESYLVLPVGAELQHAAGRGAGLGSAHGSRSQQIAHLHGTAAGGVMGEHLGEGEEEVFAVCAGYGG